MLTKRLRLTWKVRTHARPWSQVVKRASNRAMREKCFRVWRAQAEYNADTSKLKDEAARTLQLTKKGYEDKLVQQRMAGPHPRPLFSSQPEPFCPPFRE